MYITLTDVLAGTAARHPGRPALTFKDSTLTYAEVLDEVLSVAAGLRNLGVVRSDRVGVYLDKRIEGVTAMYGAAAADAVFVPVNPLLRPRQVGHILADCGARVLVTTKERYYLLRDELHECSTLDHVVIVGAQPIVDGRDHLSVLAWDELCADTRPLHSSRSRVIDVDMAAILYTSGSTGRPKGVVLSHRNLVVGGQSVSTYLENTSNDVVLALLPLSFDAGFSQVTTAFTVGAHVVLANYLLAGDVVRLCARHQITGLTCVPPLWMQLADQKWSEAATESMRYIANTGGRMPKATLERLRAIFTNARPFLMYGLTEAFRSTFLDPAEVDRRPDSIGKAIPNAEILVVRPDGSPTEPGEEGELVHRGALVGLGYWNDPERTARRFRPAPGTQGELSGEAAVWSGDVVVRDEAGFLYFVGRSDEMIKTSGYRVSPTEVEEVVHATGMVRDAVALGVEDSRLGQHIVLVVSPAGEGELSIPGLLEELKRQLPTYMVPHEVLVKKEIPRSPNGKFDRNLVRQELTP